MTSPWNYSQTLYRNAGFGLPSLSTDALLRIAERLVPNQEEAPTPNEAGPSHPPIHSSASAEGIRVASLHSIPEEFAPMGAGFYRAGHTIWELRGAEDEEGGYVLTRKHEERAVDLCRSASLNRASQDSTIAEPAGFSRAMLIRQGAATPVVVIEIHEDEGEALVQEEPGAELFSAPLDLLIPESLPMAIGSYEEELMDESESCPAPPMPPASEVMDDTLPLSTSEPMDACSCPSHRESEGMDPEVRGETGCETDDYAQDEYAQDDDY